MIIFLSDTDGDDVAIDADAIYAVTVGEVKPPSIRPAPEQGHGHEPGQHTVTLVHTLGGPLVVSQSFEAVVHAWQGALRASDALAALDQYRRVVGDDS
jgi:hypothetical protein